MDIQPCSGGLDGFTPLAMQQHPNYLRAVQDMGSVTKAYTIHDHGRPIARAQLVQRQFGPLPLNWIARGPVWAEGIDPDCKPAAWRILIHHLSGAGLSIATPESTDDTAHCRHARFRPILSAQHIAHLDLTLPAHDRLAAQHGKWRNRLRHAEAQSTTLTDGPFRAERDMHLLALEATQRKHRGYRALPLSFVQHWARAHPKDIRIFRAAGATGLHAFMLVLLHHPGATYHIGWSDASGRAASSHNLLMWRASNWLADRGYTRFDLGTVDTDHSAGLARFKIGAGAKICALGPTLLRFELPRLPWRKSRAA